MLDLKAEVKGDKVVLNGLQHLERQMPRAAQRGLGRIAKGVHRIAHEKLSGAGAKASHVAAGGYPIPVRTGHLRSKLDWLKPGTSKNSEGIQFTADNDEAIVYDSAVYGMSIHQGTGSSAKFGPRPFITDAAEAFFSSGKAEKIMVDEIAREMHKGRL